MKVKYFIHIFLFRDYTKLYFALGSRHRRFVVLRNDWAFIVMGVMEI